MGVNRISIKILISLIIVPVIFSATVASAMANNTIPVNYYQQLDLNRPYIYNVTQFDSKFTWLDLNWSSRGDAITNPGGQIIVNFTGFYDDDPLVYAPSCFKNPIPYINITFIENVVGILITNTTFYNVSNSEAGLSLAIGYNSFHSGFLIQINNLENLITLAMEQVSGPGFMQGNFIYEEYDYIVEFAFKQDNKNQNSTMIYDKTTGILVYSKVQSSFGPDLELQLSDYELNFQKTEPEIPAFPLFLIGTLIAATLIIVIPNLLKKIRIN
ncbi:MAG: hypothetical protein ACFFDN_18000 [Candidatus Hodarchaeota archaeon]